MQDIKIVSTVDRTINITDAQTNQTVTKVPAKLAELTYTSGAGFFAEPQLRGVYLFFLNPRGNTGYELYYERSASELATGWQSVPAPVQQIFNSIELLSLEGGVQAAGGNQTTNPSTATTTTTAGGNTTTTRTTGTTSGATTAAVSIVPGSSSLTNTAFNPNPVQVSVGTTVKWTNNDSRPHTVTSGQNAQPDGKFDSSPNFNPLLAPGQTFEHTFTEGAGQYPYYCALHPTWLEQSA
jgi:plastocyanin